MKRPRRLLALALISSAAQLNGQQPGAARAAEPATTDVAAGKRAFDIHCARCHGIGGTGNSGPSLARAVLPRARDDNALRSVIAGGIPGTEMPSLFFIDDRDQRLIAAYVRSLGRTPPERLSGDAVRGESVYQRAGCAACHVVSGVGGVGGPELTDVGLKRSASYLRQSMLDPAAAFPSEGGYRSFLVVKAVLRTGGEVTGARINEDSYTIQLRDALGKLHSFRKSQLSRLDKDRTTSLMPSYRGRLTDVEIDDIVAWLAARGTSR